MLIAGVVIPLAGFVVLALFGSRIGKPMAGWVAVGAIGLSTLLAMIVLGKWLGGDHPKPQVYEWAHLGAMPIKLAVNLDGLTVIMFFMVTFISAWIHVFSIGYMAGHSDEIDGESKYHRFFAYLNLFCFSMLGLVIANSLLFLFIFWELVGLCSYLLIGFYFDRKYASDAAIKAFVTNRVGDLGFIIGLGMVFLYLGDLSLAGAAEAFRNQHAENGPLFTQTYLGVSAATWMGILLFCGAVGKSAQFPLHVWLPDAMAGPTPVSALIHAATMVAAGVYLVARVFVLLTFEAQLVIATIGCITLTMAALIAIVQTDIKKVLAYSTLSQLGYMVLGMGVGAWIGALFHLFTHAFFKALLFLGSGQVIEGCHHEQDIRKMGGLRHKMPVTCWTFFVGVLAIAGAGIPMAGIGLGGYFSKDEILAVSFQRVFGGGASHESGEHESDDSHAAAASAALLVDASQKTRTVSDAGAMPAGSETAAADEPKLPGWLFYFPILIAYVTPFYMMRCWWLTFMGKPRDEHVHEHAHESKLMYVPLVVLAVGTLISSYFVFRPLVAEAAPKGFLVLVYDASHDAEHGVAVGHGVHGALAAIVGGAFVVGFVLAWLIYRNGLATANLLAARFRPIHTLLVKKFYFDELYGLVLVGGVHVLKSVSYLFDKLIVDGIVNVSAAITARLAAFSGNVLDAHGVDGAVNAVGNGTWSLGGAVRTPQDGRIRNYILWVACGAAVLFVIVISPWR